MGLKVDVYSGVRKYEWSRGGQHDVNLVAFRDSKLAKAFEFIRVQCTVPPGSPSWAGGGGGGGPYGPAGRPENKDMRFRLDFRRGGPSPAWPGPAGPGKGDPPGPGGGDPLGRPTTGGRSRRPRGTPTHPITHWWELIPPKRKPRRGPTTGGRGGRKSKLDLREYDNWPLPGGMGNSADAPPDAGDPGGGGGDGDGGR